MSIWTSDDKVIDNALILACEMRLVDVCQELGLFTAQANEFDEHCRRILLARRAQRQGRQEATST